LSLLANKMLASLLVRKTFEAHTKSTFIFKRGLWGNLSPKKKSKPKDVVQEEPVKSEPGEGLRSVATTNVFRAVNFELYAKPNRYMITFGILAFSTCVLYIYNMRRSAAEDLANTYTALDDQDQLVLRKKRSRWE